MDFAEACGISASADPAPWYLGKKSASVLRLHGRVRNVFAHGCSGDI